MNPAVTAAMIFLAPALLSGAKSADEAPSWLKEAATAKISAYDGKVPAVVLLDERRVSIDGSGRILSTERRAVRILTREGRSEAMAQAGYLKDAGKATDLRAWVILPGGEAKAYGKEKVIEITPGQEELYNDYRLKIIDARNDASPGTVFGFETAGEERSVFTQFDWDFQDRNPTLRSRFTLTVPQGWRSQAVTFNHAAVEAVVSGTESSWELKDLPYIEREPLSPRYAALAPRLAVSVFPSTSDGAMGPSFATWAEVSRWLSELSEKQREPSSALAAKTAELTARANTDYERIQAIGSYVQALRYVAIEIGLGRGGGYKPHEAKQVFERQYGDCKDKANLMAAMLRTVNIPAYLVSIYSGDRTYVREEWPSPQQFNHAIVAVKIDERVKAPAVVLHPSLGPLLIFDATDPYTRVGDLPEHEQGSLALIETGETGALLRMPRAVPSANRVERESEISLGPDGAIRVKIQETGLGQSGAAARAKYHEQTPTEYNKSIEHWLADTVNGAKISAVRPEDADGPFRLGIEFSADRYARMLQQRLMIFKPAVVERRDTFLFPEPKRLHPVVLQAQSFQETVKVALPEKFKVDELPEGAKIDAAFGSYQSSYETKNGQLTFWRKLEVRAETIPPERYAEVRDFFGHVNASEQSPVVLVKE